MPTTRLDSEIACAPPAPPNQAAPCEALERRKEELEEEKMTVKHELQDEEARKAHEEELEARKKSIDEQLKACKRGNPRLTAALPIDSDDCE